MALITRCPACGTRFKVVPDQLRISDGWVRCGQCAEVFDASAELHQSAAESAAATAPAHPEPVASPSPQQDGPAEPLDAPMAWLPPTLPPEPDASPEIDRPVEFLSVPAYDPVWDDTPVPVANTAGTVDPLWSDPAPEASAAASGEPWVEPAEDLAVDEFAAEVVDLDPTEPLKAPVPASEAVAEAPAEPAAPAEPFHEPDVAGGVSFLQQEAAPQTLWQRPAARKLLGAVLALLLVMLGAQAAVQQRDQIAARFPFTQPWLEALCQPFGCSVQALRQIESIVIDSSTFTTLRHGVYRLNVVLKNRASSALAVPAIELALTDTQEQAVFRRVLQPVELGGAPGPIVPGGEWTASVELSVADEASIARIVGYRLLAFYP